MSPAFDGTAFNFTDITIAAGVTVTAQGTQPLILLATGNVSISGTIDASGGAGGGSIVNPDCNDPTGGAGGTPGPGGFAGGDGAGTPPGNGTVDGSPGLGPGAGGGGICTATGSAWGAGGGAGHVSAGLPGQSYGSGIAGAGGPVVASLPPLIGGSGGGGGSMSDDTSPLGPPLVAADEGGSGGGGGGGAVQVIAAGTVTVTGTIDVSGGNGGDRFCNGGAGGGGAGGTVELLAASPPVVSGTLDVAAGLGGTNGGTVSSPGGNGSNGRTRVDVFSCIPPPTCTVSTPVSPARGPSTFTLDASSPSAATVDIQVGYSLDGGASWSTCTATASSPLANPATGVAPGPVDFIWDSRTDGVGLAALQVGVLVRVLADDGVAPVPGECVTMPFDVDNTSLCATVCGDCSSDGLGPTVLDALVGAQVAAGIVTPTLTQTGCCDVDSSMTITVLDALLMAQEAAGLAPVPSRGPGSPGARAHGG